MLYVIIYYFTLCTEMRSLSLVIGKTLHLVIIVVFNVSKMYHYDLCCVRRKHVIFSFLMVK